MSDIQNTAPSSEEELSVEELDEASGGAISAPNTNCGTNCHC